ncbi:MULTISPECIES: hypothetical protein [Geobacillus]|uniref:Uncharacterized protein n=1 Tax=Geobacillus thermocatenulatus TaxID=33938 RepID=A0A226Q6R1_9BACL|nr:MULTISPECIES: hypothetical protein [Geobacillus]AST00985.1 hypothetical protein GT3921_15695 [Geobacillus thermocatenulatus]KLR72137.1 hypothetical protein ABH20_18035 [Geobacillus sp. T6]OXB87417.1 hypothetical protein B9L19_14595 [Geobacillus thermocatenulatus]RAN30126.1 hypothetical protein VC88_03965 [Geobacillus sp. A8]
MKGSREEERHETQRTEEIQRMDDRVFSPTEQVDRIAAGGPMKREALDWRGFPRWIRYVGCIALAFLVIVPLMAWLWNVLLE